MKTRLWFSWLTFLIAIVALCLTIARCEPITIDWATILVGILAILVTTLIGWQIFQVVNINRVILTIKREVIKTTDKAKNDAIGISFAYIGNNYSAESKYTIAMRCFFDGLTALSDSDRKSSEINAAINICFEGLILISPHINVEDKNHIAIYINTLSKYQDNRAKEIINNLLSHQQHA